MFVLKKKYDALLKEHKELLADFEAVKGREQENAKRLKKAGKEPLEKGQF
jgi:hypothetical protein